MFVICSKEYPHNSLIEVGGTYKVINADMFGYGIRVGEDEVWISKNDIEHFDYHV